MTAQIPDRLANEHPRVDFGKLHLYGIVCGDIRRNYGWGDPYSGQRRPSPPPDVARCSALWRGYVADYVLSEVGRLKLVAYEYLLDISGDSHPTMHWKREEVGEELQGDFWMVMKPGFSEPRTYVPFRNGQIIEDRSTWESEASWEELPPPARVSPPPSRWRDAVCGKCGVLKRAWADTVRECCGKCGEPLGPYPDQELDTS